MTSRAVLVLTLVAAAGPASAQSPAREGVYTERQAIEGKRLYDVGCGECHHLTLRGTGHGPELAGPNFLAKWGERTVADVVRQTGATMPPTAPHSLSEASVVALTAHVLRVNGAPAGSTELQADSKLKVGRAVLGDKWDPAMAADITRVTLSVTVSTVACCVQPAPRVRSTLQRASPRSARHSGW